MRGARPPAQRHQGRVRRPDWYHLRHLQQAQARLHRGEDIRVLNIFVLYFDGQLCFKVELVQKMIDGVNTLWKEDKELVAKQSA